MGYRVGARQHEESHSADHSSYEVGVLFTMQRLAAWLTRLRDSTTNLLDSTILYASSDVGEGESHVQSRAPILLGGRGTSGGNPYLRAGQSFMAPGAAVPTNPADPRIFQAAAGNSSEILLTCLRCFDPAAPSVGDAELGATNVVSGLLA
jgi:hypothetical protein